MGPYDIESIVSLIFTGDSSKLTKAAKEANKALADFGQAGVDAVNFAADLAKGILAAEAAFVAFAAGGIAYAYSKSVDFEGSVTELNKVIGDNAEGVKVATGNAKELGIEYGISASEILESTADFKQSGNNIEDSMILTKAALDLVVVGNLEASNATDILKQTMKGFEAAPAEVNRLLDILNETSNNYGTSVEELGSGMARLSPVAASMGFTFEETAGLLTPIIEIFGSGDEAANALRTGLLQLTGDTKPVIDALALLGISQKDLNHELKSGKEIYEEVSQAFQGLSEEEQLYYTQQLVGIERSGQMKIAFSELEKVAEVTATAMGSAGSAAKEVAVQLGASPAIIAKAKESFSQLATSLGTELNAGADNAIEALGKFFTSIETEIGKGTFDPIINVINDLTGDITGVLTDLTKNMPEILKELDFTEAVKSIETVIQTVKDFFGVDFSDAEGMTEAIQKVIDGFTSFQGIVSGIVNALEPAFSAIGGLATEFGELDEGTQKFLGTLGGFALVAAPLISVGGAAVTMVKGFAGISGIATAVGTGLAGAISSLAVPMAALTASGGAGWAFGTWLNESFTIIPEITQNLIKMFDVLLFDAKPIDLGFDEARGEISRLTQLIEESKDAVTGLVGEFGQIPTDKYTKLYVESTELDKAVQSAMAMQGELDTIDEKKVTAVVGMDTDEYTSKAYQALLDAQAIGDALDEVGEKETEAIITVKVYNPDGTVKDIITQQIEESDKAKQRAIVTYYNPDGTVKETLDAQIKASDKKKPSAKVYTFNPDGTVKDIITSEVEEANESEPTIDIKTNIEVEIDQLELDKYIADLEAKVETTKSFFEYKVQFDLSEFAMLEEQARATGEILESAFEAAADTISAALGVMAGEYDKSFYREVIEEQLEIQREALEETKKLTEAQIAYLEAKTENISGQSPITIVADGLKPHLEMIWQEILSEIKVWVTEEGADYLTMGGV